MLVRVSNMYSASGNPVPNQFEIQVGDVRVFQSYSTTIARVDADGTVTLDPRHACSRTTIRYRNQFLGESSYTIENKIASGVYQIAFLS